MKPSKAFIFILVGLLAVRVVMKSYLSQSIDLAGVKWNVFLTRFCNDCIVENCYVSLVC